MAEKTWEEMTVDERKQRMFDNRLARLNKLVQVNAPPTILLNEAILIALVCQTGEDISLESLIKYLQAKLENDKLSQIAGTNFDNVNFTEH